jgi:hypothetical protein
LKQLFINALLLIGSLALMAIPLAAISRGLIGWP